MSNLRECPKCHTISPPGTEVCDCGYSFSARTVTNPVKQRAAQAGKNRYITGLVIVTTPLWFWLLCGLNALAIQAFTNQKPSALLAATAAVGEIIFGFGISVERLLFRILKENSNPN